MKRQAKTDPGRVSIRDCRQCYARAGLVWEPVGKIYWVRCTSCYQEGPARAVKREALEEWNRIQRDGRWKR
jgi:hypothetical protein